MALNSYLPEQAGGMVTAGTFANVAGAVAAARALHEVGLRRVDITVIANDREAARAVAETGEAWTPRGTRMPIPLRFRLPRTVRQRYWKALDQGRILVIAAADGQPAQTLATLLERVAKAEEVSTWWQEPSDIFAPPEEGGPL